MAATATGRPWAFTAADEARDGSYADYCAWSRWMGLHLDGPLDELADEDSAMDTLTGTQRAYLYNLMARLADGDAPRDMPALDPCLATPDPEDQ